MSEGNRLIMNMLYLVYFVCVKTSNYGFTRCQATSWLVAVVCI